MNNCIYLAMLLFILSLVSISYISVTAQMYPFEPTTAHWYVKERDTFNWYVTKLRKSGNITSERIFYNSTQHSINITEGDTISITVLTLGNASEYEGTCRIQIGDQQLLTTFVEGPLNSWILPVYDRDYWIEYIAWNENQTSQNEYTLEGNLLTSNFSVLGGSAKTVLDISTGLYHILQASSNYSDLTEIDINLVTGVWFPNITLPTLLLTGVIGAEIILAIFLVRLFRRRRLEMG
ncbi:MAG: hypothetical protein ACFFCZ_29640 [Promethearchaeota archaeon]